MQNAEKKNVLKEYLESREKEIVSIMLAMYDEKEILHSYIESERYEAVEEAEKKAAVQMIRAGKISIDEVQQFFPTLSADDVKEMENELLQTI